MYQKFSFVAIQIQMIKFLSHKHTSTSLASLYWKVGERTNLQKGTKNKRTTISNDTLIVFSDDAGKFLDSYYKAKIYESDPFARLDQEGVGQLVKMAVEKGRATRPNLKCGICGEHGGDPSSVEFCHKVGLNYVSCSPFRVPIARLAGGMAEVGERTNLQKGTKNKRTTISNDTLIVFNC